jgi:uracil DNA glycosylase superfamily protein
VQSCEQAKISRLAESLIPEKPTLPALQKAAADCRACDLWENATQTVFGEGKRRARVVLIGEQPGNDEDLQGKPFVGPAGRLLDQALEDAGIDRRQTYVTNVVKHFKWEARGKRRIHKKPNSTENRRLQAVARSRDRGGQTKDHSLPGSYCRSDSARKEFSCQSTTRTTDPFTAGSTGDCHSSPIIHSARSRRTISPIGDASLHRRFEDSRGRVGE